MNRYKLFVLLLCFSLTCCEPVGPDSKKESENNEEEEEDPIESKARKDPDYFRKLTEEMNNHLFEVPESSNNELKDDKVLDESQLEQMAYTLKLLQKSLRKHSETTWLPHQKDLTETEKMPDENPQDILDSLPPLPEKVEPELTPELKEAKELYDAAVAKLNRRTLEVDASILQIKEASEVGYVPAKIKMAWSYLYGEGVEIDFEKAKSIFEELAAEGNADAHAGLGFMYASGIGVPVSQAKAIVHYTIGAVGDSSYAQMALGYRYWSGHTVESSCPKAMDLYMQVAAKVASKVTLNGGPAIHRTRLIDEVEGGGGALDTDLIEYYQLLAEKGDVQAQVGLGQLHFQGGRGVTLDINKAYHYFEQAAKTGNAVAHAFLGKIYLEGGDGIIPNNDTAFNYFKKAAEANNPVGQSGMGLMYLQGRGVPKDTTTAFKYFTMAANQGWVEGQLHLGFMYFGGIGVRRDFKQANKYFSHASQSGNVLALHQLALMHAHGLGVLKSCTTAVELFKSVCERGSWGARLQGAYGAWRAHRPHSAFLQYAALGERGYEVAQTNAAYLLDNGDVTLFSDEERYLRALQLWGRAAAQGCSAARVKLGDYHYYGLGTAQDLEAAAHHYRMASEQLHNAQATFNLGYMHERGLGLAKDAHLAKRCYDLAAETAQDARLPAALALAALHARQAFNELASSPLAMIFITGDDSALLYNWDLYVITTLLGALGVVMYMRRPQPQPAN